MERCMHQAKLHVTVIGFVNKFLKDLDGNYIIYGPLTGIEIVIWAVKNYWSSLKNQLKKLVKNKELLVKKRKNVELRLKKELKN